MRSIRLHAILVCTLVLPSAAQDELSKLLPRKLNDVAHFASSLAVAGGQVLASDHTAGKKKRGRAHVFDLRTGEHRRILTAGDDLGPNSFFGGVLAMSERWALVSARKAEPTDQWSGAVYVFDPQTWQQIAKLTAPDGRNHQRFGSSLALDGDVALIGAPWDSTNGDDAGAAYLLQLPSGVLLHKWIGSDSTAGDMFGQRVALDGNRAVVTAPHRQDGTGAAYVFDVTTGLERTRIIASGTHPRAYFGWPVSMSAGRVLIGAYSEDDEGMDRVGATYLFDVETGAELRRFANPQPTQRSGFGWGLHLDGRHAFIGVPGDANFFTDLGRVHVYDVEDGSLLSTVAPLDNEVGDLFGFPIVKDGCRVVVGSTWRDDLGIAAGAAYVFRFVEDLGASYCGPANANSTGAPAVLTSSGSRCAGENRLSLSASQLPPQRFGYFLASRTQDFVANPGGSQGNLCLGGTLARFTNHVQSSGAGGTLLLDVDLTTLPVQPGETWNFQAWFRDVNPGPTSNFTDGLSVPFD